MKSSFWRRFRRNKGAVFGLVVLALVALVTALGPLVAQHDPWDMAGMPFAAPLAEPGMPLGTDTMGRDILSGIVAGARVSLLIGVVSTVVSLFIGVGVGAVAGYFGGWIDATLMRFTELFQAIPSFALAIVLVAIILTQILPNAASPIVVMASLMIATAILLESSLSFLGLGDPNRMSWGYMVGSARTVLRQAWWMAVFPGVAILMTVLALNLVGEGLNDGLNARADGKGK